MELWKDIPGYEGLYQVSNLGRIRSLYNYKRDGDNILKPRIKRGYYTVGLRKDGVRKWHLLHRLVAGAFILNPDNKPQVNHKDENKLNNCADNLEWCTASYNNNYGTRQERVSKSNKTCRPVLKFDLDGNLIERYHSMSEAARQNGVKSTSSIMDCCKGNITKVKGYVYKYEEVMLCQ